MATEPCLHCGRDTAAGTRLFAGRVRLVGEDATTYVCDACLDDHPIRDANGVILSKERLAGMSYVLPPGGGLAG